MFLFDVICSCCSVRAHKRTEIDFLTEKEEKKEKNMSVKKGRESCGRSVTSRETNRSHTGKN